jgi:hypothetical protein
MSCAVPPELAIIMGEWRGEDIYFKLDEYGDVECDDRPWHEDVLYGFLSFRKRFMDGVGEELFCEDSAYWLGELTEGMGCDQVPLFGTPDECYRYVVHEMRPHLEDIKGSKSYYFNFVGIDKIEGRAVEFSEWEDEDGLIWIGESSWQFTANRVRR